MLDAAEIAWEFYCQETAGTMDVRDFFEDLAPNVRDMFLVKAVSARIVCAAIKVNDEIICGARHHDKIMNLQLKKVERDPANEVQGFIDQYGHFLTRELAWKIAEYQGQIIRRCGGDGKRLYSENLY
jgi:hypothetical protein